MSDPSGWKIRCICRFEDDDGFTIQCEQCDVWQHAVCVGIEHSHVPDEYLCDTCSPRSLDADKANELQTQRKAREAEVPLRKRRQSGARGRRQQPSPGDHLKQRPKPASRQSSSRKVRAETGNDSDTEPESSSYNSEYIPIESSIISEGAKEHIAAHTAELPQLPSTYLVPKSVTVRPVTSASFSASRRGMFALHDLPMGSFVREVKGDIGVQADYKSKPTNQYAHMGVPKPFVFFEPDVDLCIDARHYGNESRFIRRSCQPNMQLQTISFTDDSEAHFVLVSKTAIKAGTELTIGWDFDSNHPARHVAESSFTTKLSDNDISQISDISDAILSSADCVCESKTQCLFVKLRKLGTLSKAQSAASDTDTEDEEQGKRPTTAKSMSPVDQTISSREERKIREMVARIERLEDNNSSNRKRKKSNSGQARPSSPSLSPKPGDQRSRQTSTSEQADPKPKKARRVLKFETVLDAFSLKKAWAKTYLDWKKEQDAIKEEEEDRLREEQVRLQEEQEAEARRLRDLAMVEAAKQAEQAKRRAHEEKMRARREEERRLKELAERDVWKIDKEDIGPEQKPLDPFVSPDTKPSEQGFQGPSSSLSKSSPSASPIKNEYGTPQAASAHCPDRVSPGQISTPQVQGAPSVAAASPSGKVLKKMSLSEYRKHRAPSVAVSTPSRESPSSSPDRAAVHDLGTPQAPPDKPGLQNAPSFHEEQKPAEPLAPSISENPQAHEPPSYFPNPSEPASASNATTEPIASDTKSMAATAVPGQS